MSKLQYLSLVVVTASIVEVRGNIAHLCMLAYLSDPEVTCVFDLISRYLRHMAKQSAQLAAPSPCLGTGLLVCFHSKIDLFNSKICRLEVIYTQMDLNAPSAPFIMFLCLGHVGVPVPCNVVKLVDVEEMNYFASNDEGEVILASSLQHESL